MIDNSKMQFRAARALSCLPLSVTRKTMPVEDNIKKEGGPETCFDPPVPVKYEKNLRRRKRLATQRARPGKQAPVHVACCDLRF